MAEKISSISSRPRVPQQARGRRPQTSHPRLPTPAPTPHSQHSSRPPSASQVPSGLLPWESPSSTLESPSIRSLSSSFMKFDIQHDGEFELGEETEVEVTSGDACEQVEGRVEAFWVGSKTRLSFQLYISMFN